MTERIAFVDLAGRHAGVAKDVEDRVISVLRAGQYIGGTQVACLEAEVARRMGRTRGVGVGSGTDGLVLALAALGVGPDDEVIVPAVSFVATATAVLQLGAVPVVVDVLPDRPLIDPAAVTAALTERTRAVVPVHLFGDQAPTLDVPVPVVDDAAQALGSHAPVGQGQAAVVSFYPTKVLGGAGDGGMVLTDDEQLAQRVATLANHGRGPAEAWAAGQPHMGMNSRLDAVQAAVLLGHLDGLDARLAQRRVVAQRLDAVAGAMGVARDPGSPVTVYALRHPDRDQVVAALDTAGIDTCIYYPHTLADHPAVAGRVRTAGALAHGKDFCREVFSVPCYAGLTDVAVQRICHALEPWA